MSKHDSNLHLAQVSLLAACALVLSYIETLIPLSALLPGLKLGLANLAVAVALYELDIKSAAAIALVKVFATSCLFGSPVMFVYSLAGTTLSFIGMAILTHISALNFVPISIIAAILHNIGQLLVIRLVFGTATIWASLPLLVLAACITGTITGIIGSNILDALHQNKLCENAPCNTDICTTLEQQINTPSKTSTLACAKLLVLVVYLVILFWTSSPVVLATLGLICAAALIACKIPLTKILTALRPFVWLFVFVAIFDALFIPEGIWVALRSIVRFVLALTAGTIFAHTTSSTDALNMASTLTAPLAALGLNTKRANVALGLTMQFVPVLIEDFNGDSQTQPLNSANTTLHNLAKNAQAYALALTPLFVRSFAYAEKLAEVLDTHETINTQEAL